MAKSELTIVRAPDGSVTLRIKGKTLTLSQTGDGEFFAEHDLPDLKSIASAALESAPKLGAMMSTASLQVFCDASDRVTELRARAEAEADTPLSDVLPDSLDLGAATAIPAHTTDIATSAHATAFEFRFEVGTNRFFIGCAADLPTLDGPPVAGRVEIGMTAPVKSPDHSIGVRWAETPQSVLFSHFLAQLDADETLSLPSLRITPKQVVYHSGGDVRCHAAFDDPGRFAFEGSLELDLRDQKLAQVRAALAADPSPMSVATLTKTQGLPALARLPGVVSDAQVTQLAADLNLEDRIFKISGQVTNLLNTQADLALTYRGDEAHSVRLQADLDTETPVTLAGLFEQAGFADGAAALVRHMPFARLPARLRDFTVDTQGPKLSAALRLGDDGAWGDVALTADTKPDGHVLQLKHHATSGDVPKRTLGDVLDSDLMPAALQSQLNAVTRLGTAKSGLANVLLGAALTKLDLDLATPKSGGTTADITGEAMIGGLPMHIKLAVGLGDPAQNVRLSAGVLPDHFVTLDGLAEALDIPLDALLTHLPLDHLPLTRMAVQDLTIDTKAKRFSITTEATNGYDPKATGQKPYRCKGQLEFKKQDKGFTFNCNLDAKDAPVNLRGLVADLQLDKVSALLKDIGDIGLSSCALALDSTKQTVDIACTAQVSLGDLIRAAGVDTLPHGVPTDLKLDGFSVKIENRTKVTIKGALDLKGARAALFELADDTKLDIARLEVSLTRDKDAVEGKIKLKGTPKVDLIDDIRFESYAFELGYKSGKDSKAWSLSGDVSAHLFGRRALTLHAAGNRDGKKRKIAFTGKLDTLAQIELSPSRVAKALNVSLEVATQILADLKEAKHIDAFGQIAKGFDPDADGFDLGLRAALAPYQQRVIDLIEDASPLFSVAVAGQKLIDIDPRAINLSLEWDAKKRTTAMEISSDLRMYAPGQPRAPLATLEKGTLALKHQSGDTKTKVEFTAKNARVQLPPLFQFAVPKLNESADGKTIVEASDQHDMSIEITFDKIWFEKTAKTWEVGGKGGLILNNMPEQLAGLLSETPQFEMKASNAGLTFAARDAMKPIVIPDLLAQIKTSPQFALPKLGEGRAQLKGLDLTLSEDIALGLDFGIALPAQFNEALGMPKGGQQIFRTWAMKDAGMIDARLEFGSNGVAGQIKGNPFNDLKGITVVEDGDKVASVRIDFDQMFGPARDGKPYGALDVVLPKIALDLQSGSFKASGGYEFDTGIGLRLPLEPLRELLIAIGLKDWAAHMPSGFPIKSRDLTPAGLQALFADLGVDLPNELLPIMELWEKEQAKLPTRLVDSLKVTVPNTLEFDIDVTPDAGVSFAVKAGKRGDDSQPPLQFILPTLMGLQSMKLWKMSIGAAFGGAALKGEIDADIDLFDYPTILGSMVLLDDPNTAEKDLSALARALPRRSELQRTMVIDDFSYLIIIATIIPIPVPLFYRELAIVSHGIEDVRVEMSASFPKPHFGFVEGLELFSEAYRLFTDEDAYFKDVSLPLDLSPQSREAASGSEPLNLTFSAGPLYAQLPRYIQDNGKEVALGVRDSYRLLDTVKLTKVLLNGGKKLVTGQGPGYLLSAIPPQMRQNKVQFKFLEALNFDARWAIATPTEFKAAKDITIADGPEAASVAKAMTDAIDVIRDRNGAPSDGGDNGVVVYLRGAMAIENAMHFVAESGMMIEQATGLVAMQIEGRIGPANASPAQTPLLANFKGAFAVNADGTTKDSGVRLSGDAVIAIFGDPILHGQFDLRQGANRAEIHIQYDAGTVQGLVSVNADMHGHMSPDRFHLKADGAMRIAMIAVQSALLIDVDKSSTQVALNAEVKVDHVFTVRFRLFAQGHGPDTQLTLRFEADFLSILKIEAQARYAATSELKMAGALRLLGQPILTGSFTATPQDCTFSGDLVLIPDTEVFGLGARVKRGQITASGAHISASGHYRFGPFQGESHIRLNIETQGQERVQEFMISLRNFLSMGADLDLLGQVENEKSVLLSAAMPKPLRLMSGLVDIVASDSDTTGPKAHLSLGPVGSHFGVDRFQLDGALSVLGLRSAVAVDVDGRNDRLHARLSLAPKSGAPITGHFIYQTDKLEMGIDDFTQDIDLGGVLRRVISFVGLKDPGIRNFGATVSLSNTKVRLNKTRARAQHDAALAARQAEIKARLKALNTLLDDIRERTGALDRRLDRAVDSFKNAIKTETNTSERDKLVAVASGLIEAQTYVNLQMDYHKRAAIKAAKAKTVFTEARRKYDIDIKPISKTSHLIQVLEDAYSLYFKHHKTGHRKGDYDLASDRLREHVVKYRRNLFPGKSEHDVGIICDNFKHHLWWSRQGIHTAEDTRYYNHYRNLIVSAVSVQSTKLWKPTQDLQLESERLDKAQQVWKQKWDSSIATADQRLNAAQGDLAKITISSVEHKRMTEYAAFEANQQVQNAFLASPPKAAFNRSGFRAHVSAKLSLTIKLPDSSSKTFDFLNVNWGLEDAGHLGPEKSIIDRLPEVIERFVADNFMAVVGKAFATVFELIDYVLSLIGAASRTRRRRAVKTITPQQLLSGYSEVGETHADMLITLGQ